MDRFWGGLTLGLFLGLILTACAGMRVYVSDPKKGGMVREQDKELVKYSDTKGWMAMTSGDFQEMLTKYSACQEELKQCKDSD